MRPVILVLLLLGGACTSVDAAGTTVAGGEGAVPAVTATSTTLQATTTTSSSPTAASFQDLATDALVTPTGVVVAVMDQTPAGYLVRAPCGDEALVAAGSPVGGVRVVIDPGHGGEVDTGAVGPNGLIEKNINLELSQALQAKLIVRGITVLLTRTGDYASVLGVRAALADHVGADLVLSVHHNAPTPGVSSEPGTEVFVQSQSPDSRRLGGLVWGHVVDALSGFDVAWSAAPDAGVLSVLSTRGNDAYGMIRGPETVSALVEVGYISSRPEAELFATNRYVEAAAEALADAVEAYLDTDDPGVGFVAEPRVFNPQPGIGGSVCINPDLD
ncbi:MAG TPA: N-acetylmuramoyl-L-alanine amidase [Acidimicrobiia bacterium]|nr:N-acetylmuramoyl-L-alanine amidase [Acidimicrobiia bacterium]